MRVSPHQRITPEPVISDLYVDARVVHMARSSDVDPVLLYKNGPRFVLVPPRKTVETATKIRLQP